MFRIFGNRLSTGYGKCRRMVNALNNQNGQNEKPKKESKPKKTDSTGLTSREKVIILAK